MKRIAMVSEHASPLASLGGADSGGQNVYVAQVAQHLARSGYQVDVFTRREDASQPTVVPVEPNFRVVHVTAGPAAVVPKEDLLPYMTPFADWMRTFIRQHGSYDLVHANFWMSGLVAVELQRTLAIPFVVTFHALGKVRQLHQGSADRFPAERNLREQQIMGLADRIIAECPQDRRDQIELYAADHSKIRMVPCGFDHREFQPLDRSEARRIIGYKIDEPLVVHIGRMVRRKGVDNILRGFARMVHDDGIPARLLVVGGESDQPDPTLTPELGYLQRIAAEERILDRVTFTGRRGRDVLRYYYCAADVFVTTPWYEPFGITPVEAMACGVPVIGSDVGGIKYTVMHHGTGLLVPPHDPQSLRQALSQILTEPGLKERFAKLALRRANTVFTWSRVASAIAEIYEDVISSRVKTPASRSSTSPLSARREP